MIVDVITPLELDPRFPIGHIKWARGYVFIETYLEDLGVKSFSTHVCEQEASEYEYLQRFLGAHYKQVKADAKDYIDTELKEGFIIDEMLIKKYLQ